jgi:hypothetical protein
MTGIEIALAVVVGLAIGLVIGGAVMAWALTPDTQKGSAADGAGR